MDTVIRSHDTRSSALISAGRSLKFSHLTIEDGLTHNIRKLLPDGDRSLVTPGNGAKFWLWMINSIIDWCCSTC